MIKKFKKIKRDIIIGFSQAYANFLYMRMETALDLEDNDLFWSTYEQASQLNSYCVVFHDIYLD